MPIAKSRRAILAIAWSRDLQFNRAEFEGTAWEQDLESSASMSKSNLSCDDGLALRRSLVSLLWHVCWSIKLRPSSQPLFGEKQPLWCLVWQPTCLPVRSEGPSLTRVVVYKSRPSRRYCTSKTQAAGVPIWSYTHCLASLISHHPVIEGGHTGLYPISGGLLGVSPDTRVPFVPNSPKDDSHILYCLLIFDF